MKKIIQKLCKEIEKEKKVKILFCVEGGSKVWRVASEDSDCDVRFVFVRKLKDYITINPSKDVITKNYDKEGNPCPAEGCYIDFQGFDIFKFVRMLSSSNPTVIEWLMSDIVYYGRQNEVFKEFAVNQFKPISLYYHYKSMCKQNYLKYLKSGNLVTYKKYLYAGRGVINAKWVAHKKTVPPIDFTETLEKATFISKIITNKLKEIIKLKSQGREKDVVQNIVQIDDYIERFLKDDSGAPKEKQLSTYTALEKELKKIVLDNKYFKGGE